MIARHEPGSIKSMLTAGMTTVLAKRSPSRRGMEPACCSSTAFPLRGWSTNWLRSAQPGARIGFRVRYPYVHDKQTGRTVSSLVFGDRYRKAGQWERLRLTDVPQRMREKEAALRVEFDSDVDLRGAFVDAIIVDVYNQPGVMTVRLDDVSIDHLVPVGSVSVAARPSLRKEPEPSVEPSLTHLERPAFAPQRVTRIIEHNGEPLAYLRSLGFDAVLLSTPPEATILREANQARMLIYAPPPT